MNKLSDLMANRLVSLAMNDEDMDAVIRLLTNYSANSSRVDVSHIVRQLKTEQKRIFYPEQL